MSISRLMQMGAAGAAGGGTFGYLTAPNNDSLTVLDLSDPTNISEVATITDATNMSFPVKLKVDLNSGLAYVACGGTDGLAIVDISNPSSMSVVGSIQNTDIGAAQDVALDTINNVCYVCSASHDRVTSIDVSNPSAPSIIYNRSFINKHTSYWLGIKEAYNNSQLRLYMADYQTDRIFQFDQLPSNFDINSQQSDADFDGASGMALDFSTGQMYVQSAIDQRLTTMAFTDTGFTSGTLRTVVTGLSGSETAGVALDQTNKVVYSPFRDTFFAINVSNPLSMSIISSFSVAGASSLTGGVSLDLERGIAYLPDAFNDRIFCIDISNPSSMSVIGSYTSTNLNAVRFMAISQTPPQGTNAYT